MVAEQGTDALVTQLANEIIERLDKSYDLVYVDYRDELSDTQVAALVRGDEWTEESWEWESDQRWDSAKQIIEELAREIVNEWSEQAGADLSFLLDEFGPATSEHADEEWDRVRYEIEERDTGSWVEQIMRQTPRVLLRINVIDEDSSYSFEDVKARRVLKDLGMRATRANVETVERTLLECSPEYSVLLGYWIVAADVADIYKLPNDPECKVEIANPYLYLGNPFAGSGFISERPLEGVVTVKRGDLRTDRDAFGYAVDEVYGGLRPSDFEAEIRLAPEQCPVCGQPDNCGGCTHEREEDR